MQWLIVYIGSCAKQPLYSTLLFSEIIRAYYGFALIKVSKAFSTLLKKKLSTFLRQMQVCNPLLHYLYIFCIT